MLAARSVLAGCWAPPVWQSWMVHIFRRAHWKSTPRFSGRVPAKFPPMTGCVRTNVPAVCVVQPGRLIVGLRRGGFRNSSGRLEYDLGMEKMAEAGERIIAPDDGDQGGGYRRNQPNVHGKSVDGDKSGRH